MNGTRKNGSANSLCTPIAQHACTGPSPHKRPDQLVHTLFARPPYSLNFPAPLPIQATSLPLTLPTPSAPHLLQRALCSVMHSLLLSYNLHYHAASSRWQAGCKPNFGRSFLGSKSGNSSGHSLPVVSAGPGLSCMRTQSSSACCTHTYGCGPCGGLMYAAFAPQPGAPSTTSLQWEHTKQSRVPALLLAHRQT